MGSKKEIFDQAAKTVQIQSKRVDSLVKAPTELLLLKTDTEGFDHLALSGAAGIVPHTRFIIFECHYLQRADRGGPGTSLNQTQEFLSSFGFAVFKIGSDFLMRFDGDCYYPGLDEPSVCRMQGLA